MPNYKLPYQGYFQGLVEVTHDAPEAFHAPQFNLTETKSGKLQSVFDARKDAVIKEYELP